MIRVISIKHVREFLEFQWKSSATESGKIGGNYIFIATRNRQNGRPRRVGNCQLSPVIEPLSHLKLRLSEIPKSWVDDVWQTDFCEFCELPVVLADALDGKSQEVLF